MSSVSIRAPVEDATSTPSDAVLAVDRFDPRARGGRDTP